MQRIRRRLALRLNLLGSFQAWRQVGVPLPLHGSRARALLAYLAREPGRAYTRDQVAER